MPRQLTMGVSKQAELLRKYISRASLDLRCIRAFRARLSVQGHASQFGGTMGRSREQAERPEEGERPWDVHHSGAKPLPRLGADRPASLTL